MDIPIKFFFILVSSSFFSDLKQFINPDKSKVICFKEASFRECKPTIFIDDKEIENCSSAKFLGMIVDEKLNWKEHVDDLVKRLCTSTFLLKRVAKVVDLETSLIMFNSLIQSKISYGITLWGGASIENLNTVAKIQRRAIRYALGLRYREELETYYVKYKILSVPALYLKEVLCLGRKKWDDRPKLGDHHEYSTRNREEFAVPRHSTSLFEKKPTFAALKKYSKLPQDLKECKSEESFRKNLKSFLIDQSFMEGREAHDFQIKKL